MEEFYFDNSTATSPFSCILDQMHSLQKEYWASTGSLHRLGQQQHTPLLTAKKKIFALLGASDLEGFYFSSSGAEAISQVFFSHYFNCVKETGKTHFLASDMEEAPCLLSLKRMEKWGCSAKTLPVNKYGQLTKEVLEEGIRPRASLLSISWANGLTGVIHPLEDIKEVCKKKNISLHLDVSTVVGKNYFTFQDLDVDYLTFDGSLFHAPRGSAGTLVKSSTPFAPFTVGEFSEPTVHLVALAEALEMAAQNFDHVCTEIGRLRDRFEQNIRSSLADVFLPFEEADRVPTISVLSFPSIFNEAFAYLLHSRGVYVSIGGGRHQKLSHLMHLCNFERRIAQGALSFSFAYDTSEKEVDLVSEIILDTYKKLIKTSRAL
ncbi:MAG: aminotransferase class V-fold PLP-dependent enzyme [Chlamydiae bacterium]|nr:aminotransferase class V-fold PLP-dependent enzyme [Chlamydiota bacterium]